MSKDQLVIVYVKNPVPGKVKTRLAAEIGNEKAASIYQNLLNNTKKTVIGLPMPVRISFYDNLEADRFWVEKKFDKIDQMEGDLGVRMSEDFQNAFNEGFRSVVIIGSDIYGLNESHILEAFNSLESSDSVLGPAYDGGYYLVGLNSNTFYKGIFENIEWSTDRVLAQTLDRLSGYDLEYHTLSPLRDIDTLEDLPEGWLK